MLDGTDRGKNATRTLTKREPLSEDLRNYAIQKGKEILEKTRVDGATSRSFGRERDPFYVGDLAISVLVLQGDQVYGVMVYRE